MNCPKFIVKWGQYFGVGICTVSVAAMYDPTYVPRVRKLVATNRPTKCRDAVTIVSAACDSLERSLGCTKQRIVNVIARSINSAKSFVIITRWLDLSDMLGFNVKSEASDSQFTLSFFLFPVYVRILFFMSTFSGSVPFGQNGGIICGFS